MKIFFKTIYIFIFIISAIIFLLDFCNISLIIQQVLLNSITYITLIICLLFLPIYIKKPILFIVNTLITSCIIFWSSFNIGYTPIYSKFISPNNTNIFIISEYNQPIGNGITIYKKLYGFLYIKIDKYTLATSYKPISENEGTIVWYDNNQANIKFKLHKDSMEYIDIFIIF